MRKPTPHTKSATDADKLIGLRVRARRKALRVSQEKLGKAIGVSFQQVQKYENGANRISASRLAVIAQQLDCAVPELLGDAAMRIDGAAVARQVRSLDAQVDQIIKTATALKSQLGVIAA